MRHGGCEFALSGGITRCSSSHLSDQYLMEKALQRAYSSRRAMNDIIRRMERGFAECLAEPRILVPSPDLRFKTNSRLEWLITWAIKIPSAPDYLWCDGARITALQASEKRTFIIRATVLIDSEGHQANRELREYCGLSGCIEMNSTWKRLRRYHLTIHHKGKSYEMRKRA